MTSFQMCKAECAKELALTTRACETRPDSTCMTSPEVAQRYDLQSQLMGSSRPPAMQIPQTRRRKKLLNSAIGSYRVMLSLAFGYLTTL